MPVTSEITLTMLLAEMERQHRYFKQHYPALVKKGKVTPYERDHRIAVNEKMINLIKQAIENKGTDKPKFLPLLNQIPC